MRLPFVHFKPRSSVIQQINALNISLPSSRVPWNPFITFAIENLCVLHNGLVFSTDFLIDSWLYQIVSSIRDIFICPSVTIVVNRMQYFIHWRTLKLEIERPRKIEIVQRNGKEVQRTCNIENAMVPKFYWWLGKPLPQVKKRLRSLGQCHNRPLF